MSETEQYEVNGRMITVQRVDRIQARLIGVISYEEFYRTPLNLLRVRERETIALNSKGVFISLSLQKEFMKSYGRPIPVISIAPNVSYFLEKELL